MKHSMKFMTAAAVMSAAIVPYVVYTETVEAASVIDTKAITYTMEADPNGPMAEFITGYLSPYFSNAQLTTIDGKQYIDMTLTGKAYGFAQLQYFDAKGAKQNIEVVSSTGEKLEQVRVVRLPLVQDANGTTKIFVDSGDLGYGSYTLFFSYHVPEEGNPFTDISHVSSKNEIIALYNAGITKGTTATTYSPNATITRAQFAVMIARALDVKPTKETSFTDIKGKSYEDSVQALAEIGIVTVTANKQFNPGAAISREQAAAMIYRMLEYKGYKKVTTNELVDFKDADKIAAYAQPAIAELKAQGIMTGSNGQVTPKSSLTRAQMAKILKNSLDLIGWLK